MIKTAMGLPLESITRYQPAQDESHAGTKSKKVHAQVEGKSNKNNGKFKAVYIWTGMALPIDVIDVLQPRVFTVCNQTLGLLAFNHCSEGH